MRGCNKIKDMNKLLCILIKKNRNLRTKIKKNKRKERRKKRKRQNPKPHILEEEVRTTMEGFFPSFSAVYAVVVRTTE